MEEVTATEIKNRLGSVMNKAQAGPVGITRRGRREFVFTSERDYNNLLEIKSAALMADLEAGIHQLQTGKISSKSISAIIARAKREHFKEKMHGAR